MDEALIFGKDEWLALLDRANEQDDTKNELSYDPRCTRLDTAIAAIWLLYRRAKWGLLAELGLDRREIAAPFERFDIAEIVSDHGKIRTEAQAAALCRECPQVLVAALDLISRYLKVKGNARNRGKAS